MKIKKVDRNTIEVVDRDKKITIEVNRVGRRYVIALSDGEETKHIVTRDVTSQKLINALNDAGIDDVSRVLSYLSSMTSVRRVEAEKAIFMKVDDVIVMPDGGKEPVKVAEVVKTYFHTEDGWRVFGNDWDVVQGYLPFQLKEAPDLVAPIKDVHKLFLHYNTPDVDPGIVYELYGVAKEVKEVVQQYVVLEEKYYDVVTAWVVGTYLRWAAQYSELLIIRKTGFGAGGSTLLKTVLTLSARPLPLAVQMSPASLYRIVDFAMPTVPVDEIREDELPSETLGMFKLLAESAYDKMNKVYRVVDGEVVAYSTYANVVLVDTTDKFITYSAERRSWTAVTRQAHPPRYFDFEDVLKATESLREKLYALGIALPTMYRPQWKTLTAEQGLGVLKFLARASRHLCDNAEIFESALETVSHQLEYARQTSLLSDPKRMVLHALQMVIEDAKRELEMAASSPSNASEYITITMPEDPEYRCGIIYLEKLVRELRRRFMEVVQVDTRRLDSIHYTTSEVRFWYRVSKDVEMYLKSVKIKTLLAELGIRLELDKSRHYFVRVCRETS